MTAWLRTQRHAFGEALRLLRDDRGASALGVAAIGVSFAAAVAAAALLVALPGLPARLGAAPALTLYLHADVADADAAAVEERLRARTDVTSVRRIGRDAALRELGESMGLDGIADKLPRNPLPDTVVAVLRDPSFDTLERLRNEALSWPNVELALFDREAAQRLDARMRLARNACRAACIVMILCALGASVAATLRWLPARLAVMRLTGMLGGTPAQVFGPVFYAGATQALAGAFVAAALLGLAGVLLKADAEAVFGAQGAAAASSSEALTYCVVLSILYIAATAVLSLVLAVSGSRKRAEK